MTTPKESRDAAVNLLTHYITRLMKRELMYVDNDTRAELAELVDHIIDASVSTVMERLNGQTQR